MPNVPITTGSTSLRTAGFLRSDSTRIYRDTYTTTDQSNSPASQARPHFQLETHHGREDRSLTCAPSLCGQRGCFRSCLVLNLRAGEVEKRAVPVDSRR